jgi:hypothetical protein
MAHHANVGQIGCGVSSDKRRDDKTIGLHKYILCVDEVFADAKTRLAIGSKKRIQKLRLTLDFAAEWQEK